MLRSAAAALGKNLGCAFLGEMRDVGSGVGRADWAASTKASNVAARTGVFEESAGETSGLQEALSIAGIGEEVEIDQRLALRVLRVEPYLAARVRRVKRAADHAEPVALA